MNRRYEIINKILKITEEKYPESEIYLYGSHARGDAGKLSDWDLLILLDKKNVPFEIETQLMDDLYEVELETGEIISPLIYSKNNWKKYHTSTPIYENIKREGIKIK